MGGQRQIQGVDNWFITASSLELVPQRQIMLRLANLKKINRFRMLCSESWCLNCVRKVSRLKLQNERQNMADSWHFML